MKGYKDRSREIFAYGIWVFLKQNLVVESEIQTKSTDKVRNPVTGIEEFTAWNPESTTITVLDSQRAIIWLKEQQFPLNHSIVLADKLS